jgi:hypothetical protein
MKQKGLLFLAAALFMSSLSADPDFDEMRLLESWGLRSDDQGKLNFYATQKLPSNYQPWQPDLSAYQLDEQQKAASQLTPLVIGSHAKND